MDYTTFSNTQYHYGYAIYRGQLKNAYIYIIYIYIYNSASLTAWSIMYCVHGTSRVRHWQAVAVFTVALLVQVNKKFCELKGGNIGIAEKAKETRSGMF